MQQLPSPDRSDSDKGQLVVDLLHLLGIMKRGWRFITISVVICLTLAIIHLAKTKPVYKASARMLVLQQAGRPLSVAGGGDPLQSMQSPYESLSTQMMIIRSPVIAERAIATSGLRNLEVGSVIGSVTVSLPDENARVLQIGYTAATEDEALRMVKAVMESYDRFLKDNYQKNTSEIINLISKVRDDLTIDLQKLEREYLQYRQKNPTYTADENGRTFIARRLDQWDQTANQAMVRALQLQSQLELGKKLAGEGIEPSAIAQALGQLGGLGADANATTGRPEAAGGAPGLSYERLEIELGDVEFQRITAARLLDHLRAEQARAASFSKVSDQEIAQAFYDEPVVAELRSDLNRARARYDQAKRRVRNPNDPALAAATQQVRGLQKELDQLWHRRRPAIVARLTVDAGSIHQAQGELTALTAKEAALRERLQQVKADRLGQLEREREQLAKAHGPQDPKVLHLQEQIARLKGKVDDVQGRLGQAQTRSLLTSIEQSLGSLEGLRAKIQQRFETDVREAKKAEIGMLAESNMRSNLERQRALFNSVVDQLKQAQLVSDFGSVSAQTINPPTSSTVRPQMSLILIAALAVGVGLGGGTAFLVDLLDPRLRSVTEMRRALDYFVLGVIPELARDRREEAGPIGLISYAMPRSLLSEAYKSVRTNLEFIRRNQRIQVILISSPQPGDGKSTTASNLAISMALAGRKVLLVDADLRRPNQHKIYGLRRDRGLTHVLKDLLPLRRVVQSTLIENLDFIAAGPEVANPAELLASNRLGEILEEARQLYDIVILDSSPVLGVTDPAIIAAVVDGIMLVVRSSATRRHEAEQTAELIRALGTPVLGIVINGVTREQTGYGYGYSYGYGGYGSLGAPRDAADPASTFQVALTNGTADHPAIN